MSTIGVIILLAVTISPAIFFVLDNQRWVEIIKKREQVKRGR